MSTVAIKISAELAAATRLAAKAADRSLTGQIEHWAKIGRAAEEKMPAREVAALKVHGANPATLSSDDSIRAPHAAFMALTSPQRRERIGIDRQVRFEPDPENPGGFIRISPDGVRTRGMVEGRTFKSSSPETVST